MLLLEAVVKFLFTSTVNPTESSFGIEVLRKADFAYFMQSFLFVQARSTLKAPSWEISTQLKARFLEHQSRSWLFSL